MDVVMRYETIEKDLGQVFCTTRMPTMASIPVINRTDERIDRDYRSCYNRGTALAVGILPEI